MKRFFTALTALALLTLPRTEVAFAQEPTGVVYTMTNAASGNTVVIYSRDAEGRLTQTDAIPTGGNGNGAGLENQGGIILSRDGRWLFTVNAGTNDISAFAIDAKGATLVDRVSSGGERPVSLANFGNQLWVVNSGGVNNIHGFTIGETGKLTPIPNSTRRLSRDSTAPAQIEFSPDGRLLVVTEKSPDIISLFPVGPDGVSQSVIPQPSAGTFPFGMAFGRNGLLIVSEAFPGAANGSAVSSYIAGNDGTLRVITKSAPTFQRAACWIVITNDGRYTYTSNTGSGTLSGYRIADDGSLTLLNADGITARTGAGTRPLDMALSADSRFLYVLNEGVGAIQGFRIEADGRLTDLGSVTGLPRGANGIAAR